VLDALAHGSDGAFGAVLVLELNTCLAPVVAGAGQPFEDIRSAVIGEGHADGIDDRRRLGHDLDLDAFGDDVALEGRLRLAEIDELEPTRCRPGWKLLLIEIVLLGDA